MAWRRTVWRGKKEVAWKMNVWRAKDELLCAHSLSHPGLNHALHCHIKVSLTWLDKVDRCMVNGV